VVHKDALTKDSTFFRGALDKEFREAKEKLVRMPEADVEAFAIYIQWVYNNKIVLLEPEDVKSDGNALRRTRLLVNLYILADLAGNTSLMNQTVDEYNELLQAVKVGPCPADVTRAYDDTPDKSKLRKFVLDWYLSTVQIDWLEKNMSAMPDQFVRDLAIGFGKMAANGARPKSPYTREKCEYHIHNDDDPECS
jgi:hypothetical protein